MVYLQKRWLCSKQESMHCFFFSTFALFATFLLSIEKDPFQMIVKSFNLFSHSHLSSLSCLSEGFISGQRMRGWLVESAIEKKLNVAYLFVINLLHTIILCLRCNSTIVATSSVAIELTFYTMLHEELYFLTCNFIIVNSNCLLARLFNFKPNLCYLSCSGDLDIAFDFVAGYELARQEDA
ncbi:hypothetical protein T4A_13812 [Trichinella pseudospiralis]|uniref:Uncharacterized protein n=1 Tax=Trichinella pseudospiralis TaxID=6337 RepID=A0A0V1E2Q4_TRIPS|nr:hypothetical protein T4A_13812 [Trichinella pseudospiralis]